MTRRLLSLGVVLAALACAPAAQAATYHVTSTADLSDANAGDGTCEAHAGIGDCTLRAALEESAAGCGCGGTTDEIDLDAGRYDVLTDLPFTAADLTVVGAGAATTIVDGHDVAQLFAAASLSLSAITLQHAVSASYPGPAAIALNPGGAGLLLDGVVVRDSNAPGLLGGGVAALGHADIRRSTITGNSAPKGGGVYATDSVSLLDSSVTDNHAVPGGCSCAGAAEGGGIYVFSPFAPPGPVAVDATGSLIARNTAEVGGGIYADGGDVDLTNSTLAGNVLSGYPLFGAAIYAEDDATLDAVTVAANSGTSSIDVDDLDATNTLIGAPATGIACAPGLFPSETGVNLDAGHSCNFSSPSLTDTDPLLRALADNGGPTQTMALTAGSPAIGASSSACQTTDQRGQPRPGPACDVGAFEGSVPAPAAPAPAAPPAAAPPVNVDPTPSSDPGLAPALPLPDALRPFVTSIGTVGSDGSVVVTLNVPGAGPVTVTFSKGVLGSGVRAGAAKVKHVTLAKGTATATAPGPLRVKVRPTAAGRRSLRDRRALYVLLTVRQGRTSSSKTILLRRRTR